MLAKIFGFMFLLIGGIIALGILAALIGTVIGLVWFAVKLLIPVLLIYAGYRLLTRDKSPIAYY